MTFSIRATSLASASLERRNPQHEFRSVLRNYGLFNTAVDRLSYCANQFLQEVKSDENENGVKAGNSSYFVEWIPNN